MAKNKYWSAGYIFSTLFRHSPFWSAAGSYNPASKTTHVLLDCKASASAKSIERLKSYLKSMAVLAMHPLALPLLIIDLETTLTMVDCQQWLTELQKLERETGQRPHGTMEYRPVDPLEIDFPKVVKELNACSVFVRLIERESECVLEQLRVMRITIDELEAQQIPQPCLQMQNAAKRLRRQVDFLTTSRTSLLIRLREIQRGAQTQLNFVYNFTAQRDSILNLETAKVTKELAVASKRDSSAMKTIAVLTMVFLPGTFLAVSNYPPFQPSQQILKD